jgi:integrase
MRTKTREHAKAYGAPCSKCDGPCRVVRWETYEPGIWRRPTAKSQQRGGRPDYIYRVVVRDASGHQYSKNVDTLEAARTERANARVHKPGDLRAGRQPLRELYDQWHRRKKYAPATVKLHESAWRKLAPLHDVPIGKLNSATIDRVLSKIDKPVMRDKTRILLSTILGYAVEQRRIDTNPAVKGREALTREERLERDGADKVERMPSTDEVSRLVAVTPDRYRALLLVMAFEGLRPGEAYGLRLDDLDFANGEMTVRRSLTNGHSGPTKSGQTRTLPMIPAPAMADELRFHLTRYPTDGYVFTTDDGSPINSESFRSQVFAPAAKAAKVNGGISPNQLRHHAASYWIGRGANILQVSRLLGHKRPSITLDVYASLMPSSFDSLIRMPSDRELPGVG